MTSHMHMIARAKNSDLSKVMRDFKKHTSGSFIHEIRTGRESRKEWLLKMLEEGIVQFSEQYYYGSARDYAGLKGPVNVSLINLHNLM